MGDDVKFPPPVGALLAPKFTGRPPMCAGQVWADETGRTALVVRVSGANAYYISSHGTDLMRPREWPYLLSDPVVPERAPWST